MNRLLKIPEQVIRIVREVLAGFSQERRARWARDPITQHIGLFQSKDTTLSMDHDDHLYGYGLTPPSLEPRA
mgnify:CR=1 FL=1